MNKMQTHHEQVVSIHSEVKGPIFWQTSNIAEKHFHSQLDLPLSYNLPNYAKSIFRHTMKT